MGEGAEWEKGEEGEVKMEGVTTRSHIVVHCNVDRTYLCNHFGETFHSLKMSTTNGLSLGP